MEKSTKQCPYCAETIQGAAIVCRFCNRELPSENPDPRLDALYEKRKKGEITTKEFTELYARLMKEQARVSKNNPNSIGPLNGNAPKVNGNDEIPTHFAIGAIIAVIGGFLIFAGLKIAGWLVFFGWAGSMVGLIILLKGNSGVIRFGGSFVGSLIILAGFLVFANDGSVVGKNDLPEKEIRNQKESYFERAENSAITMMERTLKAPSSAKYKKNEVIESKHPYYLVHVVVDAQNGFGAMIRDSFCVSVQLIPYSKEFKYNKVHSVQKCSIDPTITEIDVMKKLNSWPEF